MTDICLVVLIGVPGAGKTHFCKYFRERFAATAIAVTHLSFDELGKDTERSKYKDVRTEIQNRVERLLENGMKHCEGKSKWILLLDDNMYYRSMRRIYYNLARQYGTGYCQVHVQCTIDVAIARNSSRIANRVPVEVIRDMARKLEPAGGNNWEKYSCVLVSDPEYSEQELTQIWDTITLAMSNPMKLEVPISTIEHPASFIHDADLLLRKTIGQILKMEIVNGDKKKVECLSKELMCKKKDILNDLRNGEIVLPKCKDSVELENILCSRLTK